MSDTQAVATETNEAAKPVSEAVSGAPDELDTLLKQFETPAEQKPKTETKPETKPEPSEDMKDLANYVRAKRDEESREATRGDLAKAVTAVQTEIDDGGLKLPDRLVRGALRDMAEEDPRFLRAWAERGANPKAWEQVLKAAAKEIRKELESSPDPQATEDKAAVRAAVRSASTRTPEPEKLDNAKINKMSDAEFNKYKRGLAGG
jgi:hypothetical protein